MLIASFDPPRKIVNLPIEQMRGSEAHLACDLPDSRTLLTCAGTRHAVRGRVTVRSHRHISVMASQSGKIVQHVPEKNLLKEVESSLA